jgi:hypothetical protein
VLGDGDTSGDTWAKNEAQVPAPNVEDMRKPGLLSRGRRFESGRVYLFAFSEM